MFARFFPVNQCETRALLGFDAIGREETLARTMNTALLQLRIDTSVPTISAPTAERTIRLDRFLRSVERRALVMAEMSTGSREDGLELVQEAMLGFVKNYAEKPDQEWPPLFYRVLDSRILDHHRRSSVRKRFRVWFGRQPESDDDGDPLANVPDPREPGPAQRSADSETRKAVSAALDALPLRQRQAFLFRVWEGLDVEDTAQAMKISQGSVKTHLFRALASLRERLEDWR